MTIHESSSTPPWHIESETATSGNISACAYSLVASVAFLIAVPLLAQTTVQPAQKPAPRLTNGQPDLSGFWQGGGPINDIAQGLPKGETIPLLPSAKTIMDARLSKDDPQANCLPSGVPRIAPYPWRIVQTPTHIFFLFEGNIHSYRQIFMDGRQAPGRSGSDVVRALDRALRRRHAGRGHRRLQRQVLVRLQGPPAHRAPAHRRTLHAEGLLDARQSRSRSTIRAPTHVRSR